MQQKTSSIGQQFLFVLMKYLQQLLLVQILSKKEKFSLFPSSSFSHSHFFSSTVLFPLICFLELFLNLKNTCFNRLPALVVKAAAHVQLPLPAGEQREVEPLVGMFGALQQEPDKEDERRTRRQEERHGLHDIPVEINEREATHDVHLEAREQRRKSPPTLSDRARLGVQFGLLVLQILQLRLKGFEFRSQRSGDVKACGVKLHCGVDVADHLRGPEEHSAVVAHHQPRLGEALEALGGLAGRQAGRGTVLRELRLGDALELQTAEVAPDVVVHGDFPHLVCRCGLKVVVAQQQRGGRGVRDGEGTAAHHQRGTTQSTHY
eukprot:PhM_4_TR16008/c0_g1_i1/m.54629